MWFAASYGYPGNRGGGSNVPVWTRDGAVLYQDETHLSVDGSLLLVDGLTAAITEAVASR